MWEQPTHIGIGVHNRTKILSNPGIEPRSPALQVDSLPAEPQGEAPKQFSGLLNSNIVISKGLLNFSNTAVFVRDILCVGYKASFKAHALFNISPIKIIK